MKSLICSKDDPNYGRPERNSASAQRAAAREAKMRGDICDVCEARGTFFTYNTSLKKTKSFLLDLVFSI